MTITINTNEDIIINSISKNSDKKIDQLSRKDRYFLSVVGPLGILIVGTLFLNMIPKVTSTTANAFDWIIFGASCLTIIIICGGYINLSDNRSS